MDSSPINPTDDLTGKTLVERFHIMGKLGKGGMGAIYMAHDSILDRDVAIKTVARTNLNDQELMRFQREAKAACTLKHPNVIQLLDFGVLESGQPFMVMELIQGQSLAELIEQGPQSPRFVLQIIEQVAGGMLDVHKSGIVHRDLKTGNIMLLNAGVHTNQPIIKILDFGIAKSLGQNSQDSAMTKAGQIFGSPNSMSPEQVRGESLDHRSDIYSLGCIAFEMLTGRPLFVGESVMDVVSQHINEPPPRLWEACDQSFPMELERLVAHMVLKDPEERYQSMEDVIRNLRDVYAVLPDEIERVSESTKEIAASTLVLPPAPTKDSNLKSTVLIASVAAAILVLTGSCWFIFRSLSAPSAPKPSVRTPVKAEHESLQFKLDMADDIHTNPALQNLALFHSGRVTEILKRLVAQKVVRREVVLIGSEIVPTDTKLIAKLQPQVMSLSGSNGVNDDVLKGISAISSLQMFDLGRVKGLTPTGLSYLEKLPELMMLNVSGCDLTDDHLKALRNLKSLRLLKITGNKKCTLNGIRSLGKKNQLLTIAADQLPIVLLGESQRRKLKNDYKIVVHNVPRADGLPEDITQGSLEKLGVAAMDEMLGPVGDSDHRGVKLHSLLDAIP